MRISRNWRVLSIAKDLPEVLVGKSRIRGSFEFEKMVLCGIEIHGVDTGGTLSQVRQNVITGRADGEDLIIGSQLQKSFIDASVLPSEGIDVLVVELSVLLKLVIIINAPVVVLVEERG